MSVIEGDMWKITIVKKEPLRIELEKFINCILNNSEPSVSGNQGLKALEIAIKILEATKINQVISILMVIYWITLGYLTIYCSV